MTAPRILIAGVGNIFLGDDAFGVEVVQRLANRSLPDSVRVVDFGIRGIDLAFALQDGYEAIVLVDAAPLGDPPGTLYTLEPEPDDDTDAPDPAELMVDPHNLDPAKVLRLATAMAGRTPRVLLIGCEPSIPDSEHDFQMQLSEPVRAAVDNAIPLVESVVASLLEEIGSPTPASQQPGMHAPGSGASGGAEPDAPDTH